MNPVLTILLCALLTGTVNAELLVHEDFEDMVYGTAPGANTAANGQLGLGVAAWWNNSNSAGALVTYSTTYSSYATGNQALNYGPSSGTNRRADFNRVAAITTVGPTLYTSFVFNGVAPATPTVATIGWAVETTNDLRAIVVTSSGGIGTSLDGVTVAEDNSDTLLGKGPFLIVSKFEGIGTATGYSKIWAISAIGYGIIVSGGITEAELDANAFLTATSTTIDATGVDWTNAGLDYRFQSTVTWGGMPPLMRSRWGLSLWMSSAVLLPQTHMDQILIIHKGTWQ